MNLLPIGFIRIKTVKETTLTSKASCGFTLLCFTVSCAHFVVVLCCDVVFIVVTVILRGVANDYKVYFR